MAESPTSKKDRYILNVMKGLTFLLFLGRGWQHLRWDAPFRALLWDQNWMEGIVNTLLNTDWTTYSSSSKVDRTIQLIIMAFGVGYLLCAGAALFIGAKRGKRITWLCMMGGSLALTFLAFLYWKEKFFQGGQLLEYGIQCTLPVFTWYFAYSKKNITLWLKIAIAATFIGHGMYALGVYPVPRDYIEMTLNIFDISQSSAKNFLFIMGILDLIAVLGIFWKGKELPFLWYAIIWGFLTALARVVAHFYWSIPLESLELWLHETCIRLGHGGVPLVLFWMLNQRKP